MLVGVGQLPNQAEKHTGLQDPAAHTPAIGDLIGALERGADNERTPARRVVHQVLQCRQDDQRLAVEFLIQGRCGSFSVTAPQQALAKSRFQSFDMGGDAWLTEAQLRGHTGQAAREPLRRTLFGDRN